MATLRERKGAASSPSPSTAAATAIDDSSQNDDADFASASDRGPLHAAHPPPPPPLPPIDLFSSPLRFIPFILLFFFVFLSISYLSTGTLTYGFTSPRSVRPIQVLINRAKIYAQELVGMRPRRVTKVNLKKAQAEGGYGGVTPSKKKKKKQQEQAAASATESVPGQAPPDLAGGADSNAAAATPEEEPPLNIQRPSERDPKSLYLTLEELAQHTGEGGTSIFLAVYGRIFDVSEGREFYGPGAGYSNLAGKDCSRAFATNCYNNQGLHDLRGLSVEQRKSIDHWYKFYSEHQKYRAVGWVDLPDIEEGVPMPVDNC